MRVPRIGDIVTVKITSMTSMNVRCAIYCIDDDVLKAPGAFRGIIRKEDVRLVDKDRVELIKCFRPGDIVLARVCGFGERDNYLLTTAEEELGVTIACSSETKQLMVPVSWTEMVCPQSGVKEFRKIAKIHSAKSMELQTHQPAQSTSA